MLYPKACCLNQLSLLSVNRNNSICRTLEFNDHLLQERKGHSSLKRMGTGREETAWELIVRVKSGRNGEQVGLMSDTQKQRQLRVSGGLS